MARIFLCHASEDKPQVRQVYERLKAAGFEPWLDEVELLPGHDWSDEIEQALETCDFVVVFLSTCSVDEEGYVQREFRRIETRLETMPEGRIFAIVVKLDDSEVPRRFRNYQWTDSRRPDGFDRMVQSLREGFEQRGLSLPTPLTLRLDYPDANTQDLSQALEAAYEREGTLLLRGEDVSSVRAEIRELHRQIRTGGQLRVGDFLLDGRFHLAEILGQGGFARVWKSLDKTRREVVAIKVLHGQHGQDQSRRDRFFRGARLMETLRHPGIVQIYEARVEDEGYL